MHISWDILYVIAKLSILQINVKSKLVTLTIISTSFMVPLQIMPSFTSWHILHLQLQLSRKYDNTHCLVFKEKPILSIYTINIHVSSKAPHSELFQLSLSLAVKQIWKWNDIKHWYIQSDHEYIDKLEKDIEVYQFRRSIMLQSKTIRLRHATIAMRQNLISDEFSLDLFLAANQANIPTYI